MSAKYTTGTILIRENTLLPAGLTVESEVFLPGWRAVRNIDGYGLGRKIEEAHWTFFYLAGEIRAIALGREGLGTLRSTVKRVLAKQEGQKFNSLEITKVVSKRFLGIPFTRVTAHFRHIQESNHLFPLKDRVLNVPVATAPRAELPYGEPRYDGEVHTKQHTALISSS